MGPMNWLGLTAKGESDRNGDLPPGEAAFGAGVQDVGGSEGEESAPPHQQPKPLQNSHPEGDAPNDDDALAMLDAETDPSAYVEPAASSFAAATADGQKNASPGLDDKSVIENAIAGLLQLPKQMMTKDDVNGEINKALEPLRRGLQTFQAEQESAQELIKTLEGKVDALQAEQAQMKHQYDSIALEVQKTQSDRDSLIANFSREIGKVEALVQKELQEKVAALTKMVETEKREKDSSIHKLQSQLQEGLRKQRDETERTCQEAVAQLQPEQKELQEKVAALTKTVETEKGEVDSSIHKLQSQLQEGLRKQSDETAQKCKEAVAQLQPEQKELQEKVSALVQEHQKHQDALKELTQQVQSESVSLHVLRSDYEGTVKEVQQDRKDWDDLRKRINSLKRVDSEKAGGCAIDKLQSLENEMLELKQEVHEIRNRSIIFDDFNGHLTGCCQEATTDESCCQPHDHDEETSGASTASWTRIASEEEVNSYSKSGGGRSQAKDEHRSTEEESVSDDEDDPSKQASSASESEAAMVQMAIDVTQTQSAGQSDWQPAGSTSEGTELQPSACSAPQPCQIGTMAPVGGPSPPVDTSTAGRPRGKRFPQPWITNPRHPEDKASRDLTFEVEREIFKLKGESGTTEHKLKSLKELHKRTHPDKGGTAAADNWLQDIRNDADWVNWFLKAAKP